MPIPKPKKYEEEKDYLKRCINNAMMQDEFKDQKKRTAVCKLVWKKQFMPKKGM